MKYVHVDLPLDPQVIAAAWGYVAEGHDRHSWAGITALRACGTESSGANPLKAFSERDIESFIKRRLMFEQVRWVKMTFYTKETDFAMEVAMRFGTGNLQYGNSSEPSWGHRYENKHRT